MRRGIRRRRSRATSTVEQMSHGGRSRLLLAEREEEGRSTSDDSQWEGGDGASPWSKKPSKGPKNEEWEDDG